MKTNQQWSSQPTAMISIGKNRVKLYSDKVYLKSGTEFAIELFNPTTKVILAKIELNDKSISNNDTGIILNPGQRVWLERFISDNKKFKFDTYEVENSKEVKQAIAKNGKVSVRFFNEKEINYINLNNNWTYGNVWYNGNIGNNQFTQWPYYGTTSAGNSGTLTTANTSGNTLTFNSLDSAKFSCSTSYMKFCHIDEVKSLSDEVIETGRIEKGNVSDQKFENVYKEFEYTYFHKIDFQILPESQKNTNVKEIRKYCSDCGVRIKKENAKFCDQCGSKL